MADSLLLTCRPMSCICSLYLLWADRRTDQGPAKMTLSAWAVMSRKGYNLPGSSRTGWMAEATESVGAVKGEEVNWICRFLLSSFLQCSHVVHGAKEDMHESCTISDAAS